MDTLGYLHLLLEFKALPRIPKRATFMEIAGYPHYENVCSNILKFYLDPTEEHGLRDLLLRAFLDMMEEMGEPKLEISGNITVKREDAADDRKRMDLVVETAAFVLGIENKIYHWEANDLDNYAGVLHAKGNGRPVLKAILCLKIDAGQQKPAGGFLRYTYTQYWSFVRKLLGHRLGSASTKWLLYLNDFMETTERLAGETKEEREVTDFFIKHQEMIESLLKERENLYARLASRVRTILSGIEADHETTRHLFKRWIYQTHTLASHFSIQGQTIGMDLVADLKGWSLTLFQLTGGASHKLLHELRASRELMARYPATDMAYGRYVLQRWDLHATEIELQEELATALKSLISAADSLNPAPAQPPAS